MNTVQIRGQRRVGMQCSDTGDDSYNHINSSSATQVTLFYSG